MAKQDYILKKYVKADSAGEAILLDDVSKVDEVFLVENKPVESSVSAVGFYCEPDDRIPYECQFKKF